jgi:hypothetical protein
MKDLKQHPSTMDPDMLRDHALEVLDVIVAEFESDPMSVQCFDLRVVERAKAIITEHRNRQREIEAWLGPRPKRRIR